MTFRDHFRLNQLKLNHDNPQDFLRPLTGKTHVLYITYKWSFALYFLSVMIYDLTFRFPYPKGKWFKDLTHWSYLTLILCTIVQAVLATDYYVKTPPSSNQGCFTNYVQMDWKTRIAWILNTLSLTQAPIVVIIYWVVVYNETFTLQIVNLTTHAVNLIYVILEFCISATPVRILHVYIILIFGVVYSIFTVIYWQAGGTNNQGKPYIYSVLDYGEDPSTAGVWLVLIHVAIIVMHSIWSGLYQLKLIIYKKMDWMERDGQFEKSASFQEMQMS